MGETAYSHFEKGIDSGCGCLYFVLMEAGCYTLLKNSRGGHLRNEYNMSTEEYREKWGLPHDYPMVAPSYAAARSDLAKNMGLGRRGTAVEAAQLAVPAPVKTAEKPAKARGKQTRKVR